MLRPKPGCTSASAVVIFAKRERRHASISQKTSELEQRLFQFCSVGRKVSNAGRPYNHRVKLWFSGAWGRSPQQAFCNSARIALLAAMQMYYICPACHLLFVACLLSPKRASLACPEAVDCVIQVTAESCWLSMLRNIRHWRGLGCNMHPSRSLRAAPSTDLLSRQISVFQCLVLIRKQY